MEWLDKELKKDQKEIVSNKEKLIKEIQLLDKTKMFPKKQKISFFKKLLIISGYGKKR